MRALSAAELLRVWEWADDRHPIDRALALLCAACPGQPVEQLARLPVGRRDELLLRLRLRTLGPQLSGLGQCPRCSTEVEFSVAIEELLQTVVEEHGLPDTRAVQGSREHTLQTDEHAVRFRLPNSLDLAAIANSHDGRQARDELLSRCVLEAKRGDAETPAAQLSESVVTRLGERISQLDPMAEVQLSLACPECELGWQMTLDIASFFWREIAVRATRTLREVHLLARAYGWREADILAMSDRRRQYYLNLVS